MNVQNQGHSSVKVCVAGISGTGKSTLLEKLIRRERAKWVFIYDHKEGDMARRFKVKPCYTVEDLEAAILRGGFVIFNPGELFPGQREIGFEFFCEWCFAVCKQLRGLKVFCADELQALVDDRCNPEKLVEMLDECRTFELDCYFCTSAVNQIHNRVRKQFTEIFAFRQGDAAGCVPLVERGFDSNELLNLRYGVFLYRNTLDGAATAKAGKAFTPKKATRNLKGL